MTPPPIARTAAIASRLENLVRILPPFECDEPPRAFSLPTASFRLGPMTRSSPYAVRMSPDSDSPRGPRQIRCWMRGGLVLHRAGRAGFGEGMATNDVWVRTSEGAGPRPA